MLIQCQTVYILPALDCDACIDALKNYDNHLQDYFLYKMTYSDDDAL